MNLLLMAQGHGRHHAKDGIETNAVWYTLNP